MVAGPVWFSGVDAVFNFILFLAAAFIAVTAYRAYTFFERREYRLLSLGLGLISLGYLALSLGNVLHYLLLNSNLLAGLYASGMTERMVIITANLGFFGFSCAYLTGLLVLIVLYYKIYETSIQLLLLFLTLFGFFFSGYATSMFFFLSSMLLLFIIIKLWRVKKKRKKPAKFVLLGFILLFLGGAVLSGFFVGSLYVLGHILSLAGFCSILASQVMR